LQATELTPNRPPSLSVEKIFTNWLPFAALAAVYVATQIAARLKVCFLADACQILFVWALSQLCGIICNVPAWQCGVRS